ncbi:hypothetical protein [Nocardioides alcanivorans]|uniref:hypothetical protein n=1 Tax=Nocardioides alcanivorans TaxID=2897352 RepID=UPI001F474440|nr:hypothetical protein [Nocardioides alcanivorans]
MSTSPTAAATDPAAGLIAGSIRELEPELLEFRRDLHAHPELSWQEARTTERVATRLEAAGLRVRRLPRSGLVAEVGRTGHWSHCVPTSTRSRWRTAPARPGPPRCPVSPTRAGTTCT